MPEDPQNMEDERGESVEAETAVVNSEADEKLLRQIREDYRYFLDYWKDNYDEAAKDMRYVAADPWEAGDREEREGNGRPCLSPDELSQYIKQANNNLRQNKRAIKVNPKGKGATDKDAERRAAIIRGIEYKSNAQAAYTTAFEQCTESAFGNFRITTEYVSSDTDDVEPRIKRIPNQFTVLHDPDAKEADFSDEQKCFVLDTIRKADFGRKYPKAHKRSFSPEDATLAPDFVQGDNMVLAEYWLREKLPGKRNRWKVIQYITNGLEILETNDWVGSWIPIIGVFGEELYTRDGGKSKRIFMSLIRRARVPQMMLAYIASQEAEEFGMAPRAPFVMYEGQEEGHKKEWQSLNKVPQAFILVKPVVDAVTGQVLPLPTRPAFTPNAAAYEIAREAWRRAIQAAMGQTPLPTAAQRQNEKSGVALQKIQQQQAIGTFHITDNFDRALENCGRQLNELIDKTMDTPRHVATRAKDDTHGLMFVTPSEEHLPAANLPEGADYLVTGRGEYDVTISTGPSFQSEREEASSFVDVLVANLGQIPPPGSPQAKLLSLGVKMKNIGPIGDEIAELLDPQQDGEQMPAQAQAAIQKLQTELKAIDAFAKQMQEKNRQLEFDKQAKTLELAARGDIEKMKLEVQLASSEVMTKAQSLTERLTLVGDLLKQFHAQAHELGLQRDQQAHDQNMAEQNAETQAAQSAQDATQQQSAGSV